MQVNSKSDISITVLYDLSDDSIHRFDRELEKLLQSVPGALILDCSNLEHATSSHINILWQARNSCKEAGVELQLNATSRGLIQILNVLDLAEFFTLDKDQYGPEQKQELPREAAGFKETYRDKFKANPNSLKNALRKLKDFLTGTKLHPHREKFLL